MFCKYISCPSVFKLFPKLLTFKSGLITHMQKLFANICLLYLLILSSDYQTFNQMSKGRFKGKSFIKVVM